MNGNYFKDFTTGVKDINKGWVAGCIVISNNNLGLTVTLLESFPKLESQIKFWPNSSDASKAGRGVNLAHCILIPDIFPHNCSTRIQFSKQCVGKLIPQEIKLDNEEKWISRLCMAARRRITLWQWASVEN